MCAESTRNHKRAYSLSCGRDPRYDSQVFPAGEFGMPCALIVGKRSEATDKKTSLNAALRDFEVAV